MMISPAWAVSALSAARPPLVAFVRAGSRFEAGRLVERSGAVA
jgi:hypothetical protein